MRNNFCIHTAEMTYQGNFFFFYNQDAECSRVYHYDHQWESAHPKVHIMRKTLPLLPLPPEPHCICSHLPQQHGCPGPCFSISTSRDRIMVSLFNSTPEKSVPMPVEMAKMADMQTLADFQSPNLIYVYLIGRI